MPEHWELVRLGKLGRLVRGVSYKKQDVTNDAILGYLPVLRATNIQDRQLILDEELVYVKAEKVSDSQLLRRGDVIIAMSSGSKSVVGKAAQLNMDWKGSFGAFCAVFRHNAMAESFFVGNVFQTKNYRKHLLREARGTNINNLSKNHILDYQLLLPPLPEQRAIASILGAIQEAKFARQKEIALERERKAALMDYLFSHGTKGEPRKQTEIGEIPESWEVTEFDKLLQLVQYGTSRRCNTSTYGIPVLRIPNIVGGKVDVSDLKFIDPSEKEFQTFSLEIGDLLFVRTNGRKEYTGRCSVFQREIDQSLFASYLIRVRLTPDTALPEFVQLYTATAKGRSYLSGRASNAADGKFNINTQTIKTMFLPLPDRTEQRCIVETCRAFDNKIDVLRQEIARLDELFHAMLDELMTGQRCVVPLIDSDMSN